MKFKQGKCTACGQNIKIVDGSWLREKRIKAGMSLRKMGECTGFTAQYICDIELNRRRCTPNILEKYELLGV